MPVQPPSCASPPSPALLQVHHIDSAVCMLLDIMDGSGSPMSSPLPLAVPLAHDAVPTSAGRTEAWAGAKPTAGGSGMASSAPAAEAADAAGPAAAQPEREAPDAAAPELPVSTHGSQLTADAQAEAAPPAAAYALHFPCWLVVTASGVVYRLQLDLRAIADSLSDYCRLLAFLQRRCASAAPRRDAAAITLRALRTMASEEPPLRLLRQAFDIVNGFAAGGHASQQRQVGSRLPSGASSAASSGRASPLPAGPGGAAAGVTAASPGPAVAAAVQQLGPVVSPQVRGAARCAKMGWLRPTASLCMHLRAAAGQAGGQQEPQSTSK